MAAYKTLFVVLGPTGIGKTAMAISIAKMLGSEIISCDSRQFYKEMRIGTAVPSHDELKAVKHHMVQHLSVHDYYNASMFEQDALALLNEIYKQADYAVMTGGSGLYIDALCHGIDDLPDYDKALRQELTSEFESEGIESLRRRVKQLDPDYYKTADLNNPKRLLKAIEMSIITGMPYSRQLTKPRKKRPFKVVKIGLQLDRSVLYQRVNTRVDDMLKNGLLNEARGLHHLKGVNALNTVGYKELFACFEGVITLEKAIELIKRDTRRYARRQITWFKRDADIHWFDVMEKEKVLDFVASYIKTNS